jgi:hypothetical protein
LAVSPYTSPYAPPLSVLEGNSSGSDQTPIPKDPAVPELKVIYGTAPPFVPSGSGSSGSDSGSTPPSASTTKIDSGTLMTAQNNMLASCEDIVNGYEQVKGDFEGVKDTVFGQQATYSDTLPTPSQGGIGGSPSSDGFMLFTWSDPIQQNAQDFANGTGGQPGMNDLQAFALQQIGNAMALVGEFLALMNQAGSKYASADESSFAPAPPADTNQYSSHA